MPTLVFPILGFLLGMTFARSSAEELTADPTTVFGARCFVVTMLFAALLFAPASAYYMAFHGDWAFAYMLDASRVPSAVVLALVLFNGGCVTAGFVVAAPLVRRHNTKGLLTVAGVLSLVVLVLLLLFARRLGVAATYAQYRGGFGVRSLAGTPLGYAIAWGGCVFAVAIALTTREIRKLSLACRQSNQSN